MDIVGKFCMDIDPCLSQFYIIMLILKNEIKNAVCDFLVSVCDPARWTVWWSVLQHGLRLPCSLSLLHASAAVHAPGVWLSKRGISDAGVSILLKAVLSFILL